MIKYGAVTNVAYARVNQLEVLWRVFCCVLCREGGVSGPMTAATAFFATFSCTRPQKHG